MYSYCIEEINFSISLPLNFLISGKLLLLMCALYNFFNFSSGCLKKALLSFLPSKLYVYCDKNFFTSSIGGMSISDLSSLFIASYDITASTSHSKIPTLS